MNVVFNTIGVISCKRGNYYGAFGNHYNVAKKYDDYHRVMKIRPELMERATHGSFEGFCVCIKWHVEHFAREERNDLEAISFNPSFDDDLKAIYKTYENK